MSKKKKPNIEKIKAEPVVVDSAVEDADTEEGEAEVVSDVEVEPPLNLKDKLIHRRKIEDYLEAKRLRELCDDDFED